MRAVTQAHQVRVCLNDCRQTLEVVSRSGCGVFLGKPINPEGRPRLIFCRSIRRDEIWVIISRLRLFMILAQRAGIAPTSTDATKV
jgi:hypothetical protein